MVNPESTIREIEASISKNLSGKGILACSGGQDSTLLAVLASRVAEKNLLVVYVDTGLMRKNESKRVEEIFTRYHLNYKIIEGSSEFFDALKGVTDPEKKRKTIGAKFIEIFERESKKFGAEYLLQGTIAPDWIESGGSVRDTIKSHHNVGGLPEKMDLKLIEPLRDLYKDDIREISSYLGLPTDVQPYPGPGLAVRILGEVTKEKADLLRSVTDIIESEVREKFGPKQRPWQYFGVLLPVKSTGVHGDRRTYGFTVALRMFETSDGMSGTFSRPDWEFLDRLSTRITNENTSINRVVYDITNKPPGTIEWE